jgi:hypothetical protein
LEGAVFDPFKAVVHHALSQGEDPATSAGRITVVIAVVVSGVIIAVVVGGMIIAVVVSGMIIAVVILCGVVVGRVTRVGRIGITFSSRSLPVGCTAISWALGDDA